jgi:hypothetical protein
MKHLFKPVSFKYAFLLLLLTFTKALTRAQDSTMTATSTTTTSSTEQHTWYAEPWVWVVGGVVLILIIIALTRGNSSGRTDKVTLTKTRTTDSV